MNETQAAGRSRRTPDDRGRTLICVVMMMLVSASCRQTDSSAPPGGQRSNAAQAEAAATIPDPDVAGMEPRVARAISTARQTVVDEPQSAEAWKLFGRVLHAHELHADAAICYRRAIALDADDLATSYLLAIALDSVGGMAAEAYQLYTQVSKSQPGYPALYFRRGRCLINLGRLQEARQDFERALEIEPMLAIAHSNLGQTLVSLGKPKEAIEHLNEALRLGPEDPSVYATLAHAYGRLGQPEIARRAAETARTVHTKLSLPDEIFHAVRESGVSVQHYLSRAVDLIDRGELLAAGEQVTVLREAGWDRPSVHVELGQAYNRAGDFDRAVDHFQTAVRLKPADPEIRAWLGRSLMSAKRYDEAAEHLEQADRSVPYGAALLAELGRALAIQGRFDAADRAYARADAIGTLHVAARTDWGVTLYRLGRVGEAVQQYVKVNAQDPKFAPAYFNLGLAYEALKRPDDAIAAYAAGAELSPSHPGVTRLATLRAEKKAQQP